MRRVRRFRCGLRMQFAVGWWRFRVRFPPRRWRGWMLLLLIGAPLGYFASFPLVVYLFERLGIELPGWAEQVLIVYYMPIIFLVEICPWLEAAFGTAVEVLEFCFGE